MTITRAQAVSYMKGVTGGTLSDARMPVNDMVNDAGEWLLTANEWAWAEHAATSINLVAAQEYVALPAGFKELRAAWLTTNYRDEVRQVSLAEIEAMRNGSILTAYPPGYCAVRYTSGALAAAATPRLDLYPTPADSVTNGLKIHYRSKWAVLSDDAHVCNLPVFLEPLFREVLGAWAMGITERDVATTSQRLAGLVSGPIWAAAVKADGERQAHVGDLGGGEAYGYLRSRPSEAWRIQGSISL